MKVHTSMSDALSVFYSLINDIHITHKDGYAFVGFCDGDGILSRTVEDTGYLGSNTCCVMNFFSDSSLYNDLKYVINLKDYENTPFKLTPEGEVLAKKNG